MTKAIIRKVQMVAWGALVAALCFSSVTAEGGGRWVTHMVAQSAPAGVVAKPVDEFLFPETEGHWVWLVWFDFANGRWDYDLRNPYYYSSGTVEYRVPELNRWYYLYIYDTVTGIYH